MLTYKKEPDKPSQVFKILNPLVERWFMSKFKELSLPQRYGVLEIHSRNNILISAPTGATKTLTGFMAILNELADSAQKGILEDRIYCIYISPLKALNYDIEHNLMEPLEEMEKIHGEELGIRVAVRTGDTTAAEKSRMLKKPPHILITTPESLGILLSSIKFRENLRGVQWVVVDEIHALAENKRGVHLSLSLERLEELSPHITRVGLSATIAPLEEIAGFLVGSKRPCKIVDVQFIKEMDLKVLSPVPDLIDVTQRDMHDKMYKLLHGLIQQHKTSLIFTNTRAGTERVVHFLKDKFPGKYVGNIGAHHGSLSKEHRHGIEKRLREGKLKVVVSSTSLELGIDIGYIDLVVLLGSPKSVARALQRVGRSGHQLHSTTKGRIIVLDRDDLVECSVLLKSAIEKKIDRIHIPKNCLDVLAQHIVGMAIDRDWTEKEMLDTIRQSYCFSELKRTEFEGVLSFLAGEYTSLEDRHVYARIRRKDGVIKRRGKLGRVIYMTNIGTIPDQSGVAVKVGKQKVGTIDEGFLERLRKRDVFVLGGDTYEFRYARGQVAHVEPTRHKPPTVPSWFSEMLPLSFDLANQIGHFRWMMEDMFRNGASKEEVMQFINNHVYVDENAASSIYKYFREQWDYKEVMPTEKTILVEHFKDEENNKMLFHTLYGRRVNDVLSRALAYGISKTTRKDVGVGINDNGFYVELGKKMEIMPAFKLLKSDELPELMKQAIDKTEVLKRRFRHCAGRALMILRNYMGRTKRVGRQQMSSHILLSAVKKISNDFPILAEARREVLEDQMDIDSAAEVLRRIESGEVEIKEIDTNLPTPFGMTLAYQGKIDILRMEDRQEFLKKVHQMLLAKINLQQARKNKR